jgi:hypothetical protein
LRRRCARAAPAPAPFRDRAPPPPDRFSMSDAFPNERHPDHVRPLPRTVSGRAGQRQQSRCRAPPLPMLSSVPRFWRRGGAIGRRNCALDHNSDSIRVAAACRPRRPRPYTGVIHSSAVRAS